MGLVFDRRVSPTPDHYLIQGRAAEIARSFRSPVGGPEHMFLAMLHAGGWPVTVISPLVDLGQAEAAVLGIVNGPGYSPPPQPRFLVPNGYMWAGGAAVAFELGDDYLGVEHELLSMIRTRESVPALPGNTTFACASDDEGTWVCVTGPGGSSDPAVTREVLNAALVSLNRPALGG